MIPAPTPDIWIAFDSNTCEIRSFWKSGIQFRGKGWGFSQASGTAAPDAIVLAEAPSTISLNRDVEPNEGERSTLAPDAWTFNRVSFDAAKVHDNAEVRDKTRASASESESAGDHPLLLQSHPSDANDPVRFRTIWIVRE
ncbi:MAG: hypothetical protein IT438_15640 [Phycisphaerales bacterium]|nr:hypothetical protein [Phycisphaerales bacterium]